MKQVDIITPVYLNSAIGPTSTLRRLLAHGDYIASRGYQINVFTIDTFSPQGPSEGAAVRSNHLAGLKSIAKRMVKRSGTLTALFLRREHRRAERTVRAYLALGRKPDAVVFDEETTAHYYQTLTPHQEPKQVLFFHSDGHKWTMECLTYPKLARTRLFRTMDRRYEATIRRADRLVFIARVGMVNFLADNPDISPDRCSFFHNGIDDAPQPHIDWQVTPRYRLVCTGTVDQRKGQHLIVEALGRLTPEERAPFSLTIVGGGPGIQPIEAMVHRYGLEGHVTMLGSIPNAQVNEVLGRCTVFVLMSQNEGLPISIIEAMRAGLPVITTNVAGMPEQVTTGRNGVLLDPDAEALAALFRGMERYDWPAMGRASRQRYEAEFTFQLMLSRYCDMLDATLGAQ